MAEERKSSVSEDVDALTRTIYVKWKNPSDEIVSTARIVDALIKYKRSEAEGICVAAPNRNWAVQAKRGFEAKGVHAAICIARTRLGKDERSALAALEAVAQGSADGAAGKVWGACGRDPRELERIVADHGDERGASLIHAVGLSSLPGFEEALLHVNGDEDAAELLSVVKEQLAHPTPPRHLNMVPIMDYRAVKGDFKWLFLIGCVNGLVPGSAAFGDDEEKRTRAIETGRTAFLACLDAPSEHAVASSFSYIDEDIAKAARIPYARVRHSHGQSLATCAPSMYLSEAGAARPSTVGGQAFLRRFHLN